MHATSPQASCHDNESVACLIFEICGDMKLVYVHTRLDLPWTRTNDHITGQIHENSKAFGNWAKTEIEPLNNILKFCQQIGPTGGLIDPFSGLPCIVMGQLSCKTHCPCPGGERE